MADDQVDPTVPGEGDALPAPEGVEPFEEPLGEEVADALGDDVLGPPGGTVEELLHEAEGNRRRANAAMSLVHKEHFALLFANCFFFAGSLAAWRAAPYGKNDTGAMLTHGLDTIRGALIFALAIYAFWSLAIGLYTKRTVVWPLLLNMLFGLWVGLGGVIRGIGSKEWNDAYTELAKSEYTMLDNMLAGMSTIAPGYWMLTGASMLVLFIIVKGIVGGAAKGKPAAPAGGARGAVVAEPALSLLEVLKRSTAWLAERGLESPRLDAELLLAHSLGLRRLDLYLQFARVLTPAERDRVRPLVQERGRGVPVAYLTGEREFYSLPFHVDRNVLVPRPETEHLVEAAAARLADRPEVRVADVGTGSGCVIVALLRELPDARGHALDRSPQALAVAKRNAERHGVAARTEFHAGDLLAPLASHADWGRLDAVVSNPPYIVRGDPTLASDVAAHEPAEALYVEGADPLSVAARLAESARSALAPGGFLALEVGAGSAQDAVERLTRLGYRDVRSIDDLAGIPRVVLATR